MKLVNFSQGKCTDTWKPLQNFFKGQLSSLDFNHVLADVYIIDDADLAKMTKFIDLRTEEMTQLLA